MVVAGLIGCAFSLYANGKQRFEKLCVYRIDYKAHKKKC